MSAVGLQALACTDHTLVMWTNNANDWLKPAPEVMAQSVLDGAWPGDNILMHQGSMESFRALPLILQGLEAKGYAVGTVSELLECDGVEVREMAADSAMSYLTACGFERE
jgi:peptidoglycan/xylan/chitin deacetylase (PgdA/CDA1 family)